MITSTPQTLAFQSAETPCRNTKVAYLQCSTITQEFTRQKIKIESLGVFKIYSNHITGNSSYKLIKTKEFCIAIFKFQIV